MLSLLDDEGEKVFSANKEGLVLGNLRVAVGSVSGNPVDGPRCGRVARNREGF